MPLAERVRDQPLGSGHLIRRSSFAERKLIMAATRKQHIDLPMVISGSSGHSQAIVHYRFIPTIHGVTMELWEPKAPSSRSEPPYRFRLRRQFVSEREALTALQQYLAANAGTTAISDWLNNETIPPHAVATAPTLG